MKRLLEKFDAYLNERPRLRAGAFVLLILAMTVIQWLELDLSCGTRIVSLLGRRAVYHIINCALVFVIDLVFLLLTRRWHMAYLLGGVLVFVWSIADHYTVLLSGDVLTITALLSFRTAVNVLGGYRLPFDLPVAAAIVAFGMNIVLALLVRRIRPRPIPWKRLWAVALAMAAVGAGSWGALTALKKVDNTVDWSTRADVRDYGYPVHFLRQAVQTIQLVQVPEGYDDEKMDAVAETYAGQGRTGSGTPDVILILNESFYDLEHYTDTDADAPYLDTYHSLPNAVRGFAAVPNIGGATNRAEYELLTSNSMLLLACQAPFNVVDMFGANSVVNYLESMGYASWAMHSFSSFDYNRSISYPAMGFDDVRFADKFTPSAYGQRQWTDAANYRDLIDVYESAGEAPRLMYLLTFQNHGGYEQNDAALDTVHTRRDFGDMTDDVDEYLTSIQLSDQALGELTDYFDSVDRPVILCMVGDHAPSFISQLPAREGMSAMEKEVVSRQTPYIIWANRAFGALPAEADGQNVTLVDLVPTLLDLAGMPLSPYYACMRRLDEQVPTRLMTGLYQTAEGDFGTFAGDDPLFDTLAPYYYMEYNNLQSPDERLGALFAPPAQ